MTKVECCKGNETASGLCAREDCPTYREALTQFIKAPLADCGRVIRIKPQHQDVLARIRENSNPNPISGQIIENNLARIPKGMKWNG